jgi:hypothetical protein
MNHLTPDELSARLDDALTPARAAETDRHLASCETCRAALAELAAQDDALGRVLRHDPGEAYFGSFAARVEDRIRAAGMRGAQAKWEGGLRGWLRSPRRLAMAGVVAAVLGGAALVIITARMDRPEQALLESRPVARAIAPPPATPKEQAATPEEAPELSARANEAMKDDKLAALPPQQEAGARQKELAKNEVVSPAPSAVSSRAMVAPRTDAEAGAPAPPSASLAQPPSAAMAPSPGGTLAQRKAAPAMGEAFTRDQSPKLESLNFNQATTSLCGRVVSTQGRPVAGAVVALGDIGLTTQTDTQGNFCFDAPAGSHPVTALAVGYKQGQGQGQTGAAQPLEIRLSPVQVLEGPEPKAPSLETRRAEIAGAFAEAPPSARTAADEAEALYAKARASGSAADYEAAAARWQKIVPGRTGAALEESRFRLAEARYQAWAAEPNPTRQHAASDALIAYLRYANTGAKRDQAASWLSRVLR